MKKEVLDFFKKNPKGKITLEFGGFARLSDKFAKELFGDSEIKKYVNRIRFTKMHIFDQQTIGEILS